ncbi:MAG: hypothetical protein LUC44_07680 [Prevotellaceae bacterium]|nr:hypothetical protein [Prevotellaceae bacterium]
MNLYIRYFTNEVVVETLEEAVDFLNSNSGIRLNEAQINDLEAYVNSNIVYPKRFKINTHLYFIVIKTMAKTLEEFKQNSSNDGGDQPLAIPGTTGTISSASDNPGWYKAKLTFKRVIPSEENIGKFLYADTDFEVKLKAHSVQDCYNRVMDHLHTRGDIDPRSQFPSLKGRNFQIEFLGAAN